jgi:hypothetical protein
MPLLFSVQDLVPLAKKNLGLRLTDNLSEYESGGMGDAIPLSHLAGAQDVIKFVTLAFLPEVPRKEMEVIYAMYHKPGDDSNNCMPRLMLHFGAKHGIGDAKHRLSNKKIDNKIQLTQIESEAKKLASFYLAREGIYYTLEEVVNELPYLSRELVYNFNEKLQLRLSLNWNCYANSEDMRYLLLVKNDGVFFQGGYDFGGYPLGKTGRFTFAKSDVVKQILFLGGDYRSLERKQVLENQIFEWINAILKEELQKKLRELEKSIRNKLDEHSDDAGYFKSACFGMIDLVARLQENKQLSSPESIDLLKKTLDLVDNPHKYKSFLTEAKSFRMVAGGRLAAYMMLIAGWAAKIMSINYAGDAWIRLANEKLDYLAKTEKCANASEAYFQSRGRS